MTLKLNTDSLLEGLMLMIGISVIVMFLIFIVNCYKKNDLIAKRNSILIAKHE